MNSEEEDKANSLPASQDPRWAELKRKEDRPLHQLRLANGLRVIYEERPGTTPDCYGAFTPLEDTFEEKAMGLAHFVEHLLVRFLKEEIADHLPWQGETEFERLSILCILSDAVAPEVLSAFCKLFQRKMDALTETAFMEEKKAITEELDRLKEDVHIRLRQMVMKTAYPGHSLGVGDPAGDPVEFSKASLLNVREYAIRVFAPHRSILTVVGDLGPLDPFIETLEAAFSVRVLR
jgi:predicted Zn-dependent peptidase